MNLKDFIPKRFQKVKKSVDVGKTTVVLHLKGGTMIDGLTYEGFFENGHYGWNIDSKTIAKGAVEKMGRNHFFKVKNDVYLNVDQVIKVTFKTVPFKVEYWE